MAINALRGRSNTGDTRPETPVIGEDDANIVDCPVCKRPLDAASRRCPGCGTLLIAGVQASKGAMFAAFGLAIGLMVGASAMGVAALGVRAPSTPSTPSTPVATSAPVATTAPVPTLAPGGGGSALVPVAATAALKGTAAVNARIASTATPLSAALAAPNFDSQGVAQVLRRLNVEAGAAQALLPALNSWDDAGAVHARLRDFYESVAHDGQPGVERVDPQRRRVQGRGTDGPAAARRAPGDQQREPRPCPDRGRRAAGGRHAVRRRAGPGTGSGVSSPGRTR